MKMRYSIISLVLILAVCGIAQAADVVLENFESYADTAALTSAWVERNSAVVTLGLETAEAKDGTKSMIIDYNTHNSPFWSEACRILPAAQDWSAYKTVTIWIKGYVGAVPGHTKNQSLEDMYIVLYKAKDGYPNPVDNSQLSMLGKVLDYRVTQVADWTAYRFCLSANFEVLEDVRAIGIGMSPTSYGGGIIKVDAITLNEKSYGGIINDFEEYADNAALNAARDVNENSGGNSAMTLVNKAEDANVIYGEQALKFSYNNGQDPWWSKVSFYVPKTMKYAWGPASFAYGMNYSPLTINFKVMDPEGRLQVVLVDPSGATAVTYKYNNGDRLTAGDWVRWDIYPQTIYDDPATTYSELDNVGRVDVQFIPIDGNDYGTGLVYLDDVHVNFCGEGVGSPVVGVIKADLNNDCVVDIMDYVAFAEHWQQTGCTSANQYCGGADFLIGSTPTRDGVVNIKDLGVVAYRWLDCNMLYQGDCF